MANMGTIISDSTDFLYANEFRGSEIPFSQVSEGLYFTADHRKLITRFLCSVSRRRGLVARLGLRDSLPQHLLSGPRPARRNCAHPRIPLVTRGREGIGLDGDVLVRGGGAAAGEQRDHQQRKRLCHRAMLWFC